MEVVTEQSMDNVIETSTESIRDTIIEPSVNYGRGMMDYINNLSYVSIFVIVVILALFGVNVFYYLQNGVNLVGEVARDIFAYFGYGTRKTVKFATELTKSSADVVDTIANTSLDTLEQAINIPDVVTAREDDIRESIIKKRAAEQAEIDAEAADEERRTRPNRYHNGNLPYPDMSDSEVQGKRGFCYVGTERGYRTCIEMGSNDTCLSKEIFPTRDVCVNPSLRA
jgi:hypothetical protein